MEEVNWQVFQATATLIAAESVASQTDNVANDIKYRFVQTYRALEQAAKDIQQGNQGM